MSTESRPSFRGFFKDKIKKPFKSNFTSSIRERLNTSDTYHNLRDKYHDYADVAKNRTGFDRLVNKTKQILPTTFISKENDTYPKGFYDSIFSPQTAEDIYLETAVLCLWTIAMICVIPTFITMFIPSKNKSKGTMGVKMIFFHIFLCEFFYLIYILLSMINTAQKFQLNTVMCDFANYGMYVTVPVVYFALLFLSLERITKLCNQAAAWMKIFTNACAAQAILCGIWAIFGIVIFIVVYLKKKFSAKSISDKVGNIGPQILSDISKKYVKPYRCDIDGRLSPVFKIIFIISFTILIVLIVKSIIVSIFYKFFTPTCCIGKRKKVISDTRHITVLYVIFLLLNLFLSFPYYFVSMSYSILKYFTTRKDTFTMQLKICFLLRLSSIILQCMAFLFVERDSWDRLRRLLFNCTCKKISALNYDSFHNPGKVPNGIQHGSDDSEEENRDESAEEQEEEQENREENESREESEELSVNGEDNDNSDDVFITAPTTKSSLTTKRNEETQRSDSDSDDNNPVLLAQKYKRSADVRDSTSRTRREAKEEEDQDHRAKRTKSYGESTSNRRSQSNPTKHRSTTRSVLSNIIPDITIESETEMQPSRIIPKKQHRSTRSSLHESKHATAASSSARHHRQHRDNSKSKHHASTTRHQNHRSSKPKKDRIQKMLDHSDEV
ncbi:unnamed protein product [Adineta ricciae]|uniref:G-protein coupled receptors family 1 profile domain-containing protein n=1 Tax=Adineta ricciae TaxID=249248 RepID=A0A814S7L6_ADIRI|nr:unnamed protein product [Adineta ricciae]